MVLSGKVFLQFLLLCYNRMDTFLVTEFFLTSTNVMGVSFWFVRRVLKNEKDCADVTLIELQAHRDAFIRNICG